jgi:hypothetical protein
MIWAQTSRENNAQPGQGKEKMSTPPAARMGGENLRDARAAKIPLLTKLRQTPEAGASMLQQT